jgi:hypothetical protein
MLENLELRFSRPSEFNDTFDTHYGADNPLMWVHYARNSTGFVLGFDTTTGFFDDDSRALRKVIYQEGPNIRPDADLSACFYKSDRWEHEQEWRCVRAFQSSESRMVTITPSLVTEVVLGPKMERWQIARLVECITNYEMTHTQFRVASPSKKSWVIETKPRTVSLCPHCTGNGYVISDPASEG